MTSKSTQYSSLHYTRCFLLFQLNNQPGPLLLDVKKVEKWTLPTLQKYIFQQISDSSYDHFRFLIRFRRGFLDIRRNIERRMASLLLGKNAQGAEIWEKVWFKVSMAQLLWWRGCLVYNSPLVEEQSDERVCSNWEARKEMEASRICHSFH